MKYNTTTNPRHRRALDHRRSVGAALLAGALLAATACSTPEGEPNADATMAPSAASVPAGDYTLDAAHASLTFRVDHLGFSFYTARFADFDATLRFDPANPAAAVVTATIDPSSLELNAPPAGFKEELIGEQWLDVARYPAITFRSTQVEPTAPDAMRVTGDFTLHGVTGPVVLDVTFNGGYAGQPMEPQARIGFSAQGSFNRSDFGIALGVPAPGTPLGVSDAVDVSIEAEFLGPAWTSGE
jgi:polyisoprenoid-binding protein YceI